METETGPTETSEVLSIALLGSRGIPASYGGFETFYEQLAVRLADRGHRVTVYNRSHRYKSRPKKWNGVRIVYMPCVPTKHLETLSHTFLSIIHALFSRPDVIYICVVGNSPLCLLARLFGKKVILNVDGADSEREKWGTFASWYLRISEKLACRFANVIIADSRAIRKRYAEKYNRRTIYIPYGANICPRDNEVSNIAVLNRFGLESDQYILFVSRLTPENGAHRLIRAFQRSRTTLKLVIVGDATYENDYISKLHHERDANVRFTGYLVGDDYRSISCHCRFFVLPSSIDGTRPVLLDQMGFGNCVVARECAANSDVIKDSGVLYSQDDEPQSLVDCIDELSENSTIVETYRKKALRRTAEKFSWDFVTDRYLRLFRTLVG